MNIIAYFFFHFSFAENKVTYPPLSKLDNYMYETISLRSSTSIADMLWKLQKSLQDEHTLEKIRGRAFVQQQYFQQFFLGHLLTC